MIRYTKKELNYISQQMFKLLNDLRNIHRQNGEYRDYLIMVVKPHEKNMKYILRNFNKINVDKKTNNTTSNTMYYLCGVDNLIKYDKKEMKKLVSNKNNYYLYMKILDNLNIVI